MKKILLAAAILFSMQTFAAPPVTEKVLKAFNDVFVNAIEVVWADYGDQYEAKFKQGKIASRVRYDADGNIIQSIRSYNEEDLPLLIKARLKKKYADKNIFGVTEFTSNGQLMYHVVLEDAKSWLIIESDSYGDLRIHKKMRKG